MCFLGLGRGLKSFVEVLRFVVTEYRAVGSHGYPIRDKSYDVRLKKVLHLSSKIKIFMKKY